MIRNAGLLAGAVLLAACADGTIESADLVLVNAKIYTVDVDMPWAQAVAIRDGRFVYVGDAEGVEAYVGDSTASFDMAGRFVMPGLIDGHTHPGLIGVERYGPRLPMGSREEFIAAVKERAGRKPGQDWLRLCCWPNWLYVSGREGPHKRDLDAIVPDRPVWITSRSWHSYWVNSKGFEVLGVDADTPDPRAGVAVYVRDNNGEPTGWIKEGAGWQHLAEQFAVDTEAHRAGMDQFLETLRIHGVTTVYDGGNMGYEDPVYGYLAELERAGRLPVRFEGTYQVFVPERRIEAVQEMKRLRETYGSDKLRFRTIKLFMDGISSNRSAAMLDPFEDVPDYVGHTMLSRDEMRDFLLELHKERFDLHVHAIGDLAVKTVLDGVEAARAAVDGDFYPRVSIAHLQVIDPEDYPRFAELGVSANYTPWWHGMVESRRNDPALGEERYGRAFTLKPLLDAGANVTFSSDDWDLDVISPFLGIQVGYTRRDPAEMSAGENDDHPDSPAYDARLPSKFRQPSLEQMIRGYTINAAWPLRMEDDIGTIEAGKLADLVVLDENLFDIDPGAIHKMKPAAVMVEGQVIHGELVGTP